MERYQEVLIEGQKWSMMAHIQSTIGVKETNQRARTMDGDAPESPPELPRPPGKYAKLVYRQED